MRNRNSPIVATSDATDDAALTPRARRELAAGALLAALEVYVRDIVADRAVADEWVDQYMSPLGKRAHLEAVRRGDLRGVKHGRRILVRRAELNSFLEDRSVKHHAVRNGSEGAIDSARASEVAAALLTHVGLRQRRR